MGNNMTKKGVMSIATKIAIQMNAKLGGVPWKIAQPCKVISITAVNLAKKFVFHRKGIACTIKLYFIMSPSLLWKQFG